MDACATRGRVLSSVYEFYVIVLKISAWRTCLPIAFTVSGQMGHGGRPDVLRKTTDLRLDSVDQNI